MYTHSIRVYAMLLCYLCSAVALAQTKSDRIKPQWVEGILPFPTNSTYIYERKSGIGTSLSDARNDCYRQLVENSSNLTGAVVYADNISTSSSTQHFVNGHLKEEVDYINKQISISKGDKHKLYALCVDEYWEFNNGYYYVTRLYAKSELHESPIFDEVELSNKYGIKGFVRSLVPGWGQIYKGSKVKGGLIIAAEAIGVAGIVTSYSMKSSYEKLMHEDPKHIKEYSMSADMWQNIGYGCIAFTAAVYIYNLIDAAVAPGARRVIVLPRQQSIGFAPSVSNDGSIGIAMKYNF